MQLKHKAGRLRFVRLVPGVLALATLAGCATDATVRARPAEIPGTYYSGDGLGWNVTVVLQPDGRFDGEAQGCLNGSC